MSHSMSRRGFLGATGGLSLAAVLGLSACSNGGSGSSGHPWGVVRAGRQPGRPGAMHF